MLQGEFMVSKEKEKNEILTKEQIFDALMRRWSILILKDLFMGAKTFNDFLKMNNRISGKVLSDQLKNLEKCDYIEKEVVSMTPLKAEYRLTEQGRALNRVLYELLVFTRNYIVSEEEFKYLKEENLRKCFDIK
jgi:DNA-binding HxlR family transcriptional regulator